MIIKTITCHNVYNYGASLQAYALQHYLETLDNDVEIIDFQPDFLSYHYKPFKIAKTGKAAAICKVLPFMRYPYGLVKNRRMFKTWGRKKSFDSFTTNFLHLTKRYNTSEELRNDPPKADVYVAGSDQIWNTQYMNGKEPAFYLDFGNAKKISYAASFAVSKIQDAWKPFVKKELSHLNHISVREKTGLMILEDLGIKDGKVVVDPVFLLGKEHWLNLCNQAKKYNFKKEGYILVYDFENDERIQSLAIKLKDYLHIPIINVNDHNTLSYVNKNINDAGPLEFLSLVNNAKVVISSSFHATSFSLIFNKQFYVFPLKGSSNSSRMEDLMGSIGYYERFNSKEILPDIDFQEVNGRLSDSINRSKQILADFLEN